MNPQTNSIQDFFNTTRLAVLEEQNRIFAASIGKIIQDNERNHDIEPAADFGEESHEEHHNDYVMVWQI